MTKEQALVIRKLHNSPTFVLAHHQETDEGVTALIINAKATSLTEPSSLRLHIRADGSVVIDRVLTTLVSTEQNDLAMATKVALRLGLENVTFDV